MLRGDIKIRGGSLCIGTKLGAIKEMEEWMMDCFDY